MTLTDIVISVFMLLFILWGIFHGCRLVGRNCKSDVVVKEEARHIVRDTVPIIKVVFTPDVESEDEISNELADMFITLRTYYYSGKPIPEAGKLPPDKENEIFIKYDNIKWDMLKKIDI